MIRDAKMRGGQQAGVGSVRCPGCGGVMDAAELEPHQAQTRLERGAQARPSRSLPVWQCAQCGIRRPRLEDFAA